MAEMITKGKEQVRGKSVLLFSGGMDSLMINALLKPDILLNVSMNSAYDDRERETFSDLISAHIYFTLKLHYTQLYLLK